MMKRTAESVFCCYELRALNSSSVPLHVGKLGILVFCLLIGTQVIYGGAKPMIQLQALAGGLEILVATPGRLQEFVQRGFVSLKHVEVLVLDEADRMLDMGFEPQVCVF